MAGKNIDQRSLLLLILILLLLLLLLLLGLDPNDSSTPPLPDKNVRKNKIPKNGCFWWVENRERATNCCFMNL
jgi:hypothetical protein